MISHFCILTKLPILPKYTQIPHLCTVSPHHMYRAGFTGSSQTHIFFCCHTPSIAEVQAGLGVLFIMSRRRCWRWWHCNAPPCSMSRRSKRRWRWVQEASCTSLGEQQEGLPRLQGQELACQLVRQGQGQVQEQRQEAVQVQLQVQVHMQPQV